MKSEFDIALSFATENQPLVENVYHYLRAKGFRVFFAPSPEGQTFISGKNQREVFYQIFGWEAAYVALFVTKDYVRKQVPMEEACIALTERKGTGTTIPVYLDGTPLPDELFDPKQENYFASDNPVVIASHLAARCRQSVSSPPAQSNTQELGGMHISGNVAEKQVFIQKLIGNLNL